MEAVEVEMEIDSRRGEEMELWIRFEDGRLTDSVSRCFGGLAPEGVVDSG